MLEHFTADSGGGKRAKRHAKLRIKPRRGLDEPERGDLDEVGILTAQSGIARGDLVRQREVELDGVVEGFLPAAARPVTGADENDNDQRIALKIAEKQFELNTHRRLRYKQASQRTSEPYAKNNPNTAVTGAAVNDGCQRLRSTVFMGRIVGVLGRRTRA